MADNNIGIEAVGRDDVRSGFDICPERFLLCETLLEHGSHGSVQDEDTAFYVFKQAHQKCLRMISTVLSGLPMV